VTVEFSRLGLKVKMSQYGLKVELSHPASKGQAFGPRWHSYRDDNESSWTQMMPTH